LKQGYIPYSQSDATQPKAKITSVKKFTCRLIASAPLCCCEKEVDDPPRAANLSDDIALEAEAPEERTELLDLECTPISGALNIDLDKHDAALKKPHRRGAGW
jgi:hypothetical protein